MKHSLFATTALLALAASLPAQTTVQVDFGRSDNTTAGNWNNVTSASRFVDPETIELIDDLGAATGITLDVTLVNGGDWAGPGADFAGPYPVSGPETAVEDSMYISGSAFTTMTLTGLDAGATYDLVFYGARGGAVGGNSSFDVTDNSGTTTAAIAVNNLNETDTASFAGLVPDGSNEITIKYYNTDAHGALNVMIVTETPPLDTDGDLMPDSYEIANGTDELVNDANLDKDSDGLTNIQEYLGNDAGDTSTGYGQTLSGTADSDGDGVEDGDEVSGALNPWIGGVDGNPLPGVESSDPNDPDSDDDTLTDGEELGNANGSVSDPNWFDSDQDTLPDAWEVANSLDPTDDTGDNGELGDPDSDLLTNTDEQFYGSDPNDDDTDGDTLLDGAEVNIHGTDPTLVDTDNDLLDDNIELAGTTDPTLGDSDLDGHKDYIEIEAGSDPDDIASLPTFPATNWSVVEFDTVAALSTDGTLLYAENINGDDTTVNGITFTGRIDAGGEKSSPIVQTLLGNQIVLDLYDDEVPELTPLLETFWWDSSPSATNIGLTGLTVGKTYLIQFGRADDRDTDNIPGRYTFADAFGGEVGADPIGSTNTIYGGSANPALLFSGTFTATSTVQEFATGQNLAGGLFSGAALAFIQVREIEPIAEIIVTGVRRPDGSTFQMDVTGLNPGKMYQMLRSADLQDGFPTVVDGPRPVTASDTFTDTGASAAEGFYKVEEAP